MLFPASMDYNHVNITEQIYPREQDHVVFNITIVDDGDDDEIIEEFYLDMIPVENAVVHTPRITVEIGCCKNTVIMKSTLKVHNPRVIILLICINDVQGKERSF